MSFQIRPVVAADVPEVLELIAATLAEHGLEFGAGSPTDEELRALPGSYDAQGAAFWVARDGETGELLGTAGAVPLDADRIEIRKMYLRPTARGRGLGRRLLEQVVEWSRAAGGRTLVLDTVTVMARAIAFYEAHGFVRDDAQIRGARCDRGYARPL